MTANQSGDLEVGPFRRRHLLAEVDFRSSADQSKLMTSPDRDVTCAELGSAPQAVPEERRRKV